MKSETPDLVFFDNAAAAPVTPECCNRLSELLLQYPANQESMGAAGLRSAHAVEEAGLLLRRTLCSEQPEQYGVLWNNTGTDAVRSAVNTAALIHPEGGDVLYTDSDHGSVLAAIRNLPHQFCGVKILLNPDGTIDLTDYEKHLSNRTVLVSVPFVQPETGVIQNLAELRQIQKKTAPSALFFTDSIQGIGKIPFPVKEIDPDFFTVSGQKIGSPGGAAVLYRMKHRKQAASLRTVFHQTGRLIPAFAVLLAERVRDMTENLERNRLQITAIRDYVTEGILDILPQSGVISVPASPWIAHFRLKQQNRTYQGAVVTRLLVDHKVSVSSGSACSAETDEPSAVLHAMGFDDKTAFSALRLSFFTQNTMEEAERFLELFRQTIRDY